MAISKKPAPPAKQPAAEQRPAQQSTRGEPVSRGEQQMSRRQVSREDVEKRAYEIWKERGGEHGKDWDDWIRAEQELNGGDKH